MLLRPQCLLSTVSTLSRAEAMLQRYVPMQTTCAEKECHAPLGLREHIIDQKGIDAIVEAAERLKMLSRDGYDGMPELSDASSRLEQAIHCYAVTCNTPVLCQNNRPSSASATQSIMPQGIGQISHENEGGLSVLPSLFNEFGSFNLQSLCDYLRDYIESEIDHYPINLLLEFFMRQYDLGSIHQDFATCYAPETGTVIRYLKLSIPVPDDREESFFQTIEVTSALDETGHIKITIRGIENNGKLVMSPNQSLRTRDGSLIPMRDRLPVPEHFLMFADPGRLKESELIAEVKRPLTDHLFVEDMVAGDRLAVQKNGVESDVDVCINRNCLQEGNSRSSRRHLAGHIILIQSLDGGLADEKVMAQLGKRLFGVDLEFVTDRQGRKFTTQHPAGLSIVVKVNSAGRNAEIEIVPTNAFDNSHALSLYDLAFERLYHREAQDVPTVVTDEVSEGSSRQHRMLRVEQLAKNTTDGELCSPFDTDDKNVRYHLLYQGAVPMAVTLKASNQVRGWELKLQLSAAYYSSATLPVLIEYLSELTGSKFEIDNKPSITFGPVRTPDSKWRGFVARVANLSLGLYLDPTADLSQAILVMEFSPVENDFDAEQAITFMQDILDALRHYPPLSMELEYNDRYSTSDSYLRGI